MKTMSEERAQYATSPSGNTLYPNTFQAHNFYVDELMYVLTPEEFKVLMYSVREIMGWQDKRESRKARIALTCFVDGYKTDHGRILSYGTGLSLNTVKACLANLCLYRILIKHDTNNDGTEFELNFSRGDIDVLGLAKRQLGAEEKARRRTAKATAASLAKRKGGTSDDSLGGTSDDSLGGTSDDTNETKETHETQKDSGAKSAPHADKAKDPDPNPPNARSQTTTKLPDAPVVVRAKREIKAILDGAGVLRPEIASPRAAEKAFVRRVAPMIAALFPQRDLISEDKVAAKRIYALKIDTAWLDERLKAYANGAGDEFRHPAKDGTEPNSFWVWKRIEKEWSIYRKEKADAEHNRTERERYERECAAALAYAQEHGIQLSGSEAPVDSVHLSGAVGGPGGPARSDDAEDGIAVDAGGIVQLRRNPVDLPDVPQPSMGTADGQMGVAGESRSLSEMFRDYRMRRHLAAVDARVSQQERAST